jgi:hypothetical protein
LLGLPPFFLTIRTKACPNASSEVSQWWVNLVVIQVLSTQRKNRLSFNWVGERLGNGHEHPTHGNIPYHSHDGLFTCGGLKFLFWTDWHCRCVML